MTPDINVIKAARGVLAEAFKSNPELRATFIRIVSTRIQDRAVRRLVQPECDELATEILNELLK